MALVMLIKKPDRFTKVLADNANQRSSEKNGNTSFVKELEEPIVNISFIKPQIFSNVTDQMSHFATLLIVFNLNSYTLF